MLLADARRGTSRTVLLPLDDGSMSTVQSEFTALDAPLSAELGAETGGSAISIRRSVELRYRGQTHSVEISFDGVGSAAELKDRFLTGYKARYGHVDPSNAVELVGVRSTASATLLGPDLERLNPAAGASGTPRPTHRQVYFSDIGRAVETAVYRRATLPIGFAASGPALIEEYGSTTLVGPRDRFEVGRLGEIHIHISPKL
jgi:N-methylhydantoinase A